MHVSGDFAGRKVIFYGTLQRISGNGACGAAHGPLRAVPCVISLLVGALYNIVDQIFIANADYLGSYGNAANTVVFPLTVVALAIAVMVWGGCCAFVSMALGPVFGQEQYAQIPMAVVGIVMKFFQIVISAVIIVKTYRDLDAPAPRAR